MAFKMKNREENGCFSNLYEVHETARDSDYPKVSIIIPTQNSAVMISDTLESLLIQDYSDFEIIVIDASSTDRTLEIIRSLKDPRIRVYSVSSYSRYAMLNKGITHAYGTYLNFLYPGDFYIHKSVLKEVLRLSLGDPKPSLIYGGTMLRDGKSETKILYRELTLDLLKSGKQPTSLQACWFKNDVFREIGKFNGDLEQRGGFDLLCRFAINGRLTYKSTSRVVSDYDLRYVTRKMIVNRFFETMSVINKYFGYSYVLKWLMKQEDSARYLKLWVKSMRLALFGKT